MKTGSKGIDLIKQFEGFSAKPYLCSAGKATIGYGNTFYEDGTPVKLIDKPITTQRGIELLALILPKFEKIVTAKAGTALTQNQFDALVCHTYNTGGSDTLFKLVKTKSAPEAICEWWTSKYITANGKELDGLKRRRKAEVDLFFQS